LDKLQESHPILKEHRGYLVFAPRRNKMQPILIDEKEVDRSSLTIENVDTKDFPDFADAMFSEAKFMDGTELSDEQLDKLTDQEGCLLNEMAHEHYVGRDYDTYD